MKHEALFSGGAGMVARMLSCRPSRVGMIVIVAAVVAGTALCFARASRRQ